MGDGSMVILKVTGQNPEEGVKVLVKVPAVVVLIDAGLHVPDKAGELVEVEGKAGGIENWQ